MPNEYYLKNRETAIDRAKARYRAVRNAKTPEELSEYKKKVREQVKQWRLDNKERNLATQRKCHKSYKVKYRNSPKHRIARKVSRALRHSFFYTYENKHGANRPFVRSATGLTNEGLKGFFREQDGFSIDHIIPLCAFDITDPIQLLKANHISNLRYVPLSENCTKGQAIPEFNIETLPWNNTPEAIARATLFIQPVLDYCRVRGH